MVLFSLSGWGPEVVEAEWVPGEEYIGDGDGPEGSDTGRRHQRAGCQVLHSHQCVGSLIVNESLWLCRELIAPPILQNWFRKVFLWAVTDLSVLDKNKIPCQCVGERERESTVSSKVVNFKVFTNPYWYLNLDVNIKQV